MLLAAVPALLSAQARAASPGQAARGPHVGLYLGAGLPYTTHVLDAELTGGALLGTLQAGWTFPLGPDWRLAPSLEGMAVRRSGQLRGSSYDAAALRAGATVLVGRGLANRWVALAGATVRNERDLRELDVRRVRNFRLSARARLDYRLRGGLSAGLRVEGHFSDASDSRFVVDPRHHVAVGLTYSLRKPSA